MSRIQDILTKTAPRPTDELLDSFMARATNLTHEGQPFTDNLLFKTELYNIMAKAIAEGYYAGNRKESIVYTSFSGVFDAILERESDSEKAAEAFLKAAGSNTKSFTYTPHPNFVYVRDGIQAAKELKELLRTPEFVDLFSGRKQPRQLSGQAQAAFDVAVAKLYVKITDYPERKLLPKEESAMLVKNSENLMDSVDYTVDLLNELFEEKIGRPLRANEILELKGTMRPIIWRDQDNKPDVTSTRIAQQSEGTALRGMQRQYALQIANLIDQVGDQSPETTQRLETILIRTLNVLDKPVARFQNSRIISIPEEYQRYKDAAEANPTQADELMAEFAERNFPLFDIYIKTMLPNALANGRSIVTQNAIDILKDANAKRIENLQGAQNNGPYAAYHYSRTDSLYNDLAQLVSDIEAQNGAGLPLETQQAIATLGTKSAMFGRTALRPENRQNKDELRKGFRYLVKDVLLKHGNQQVKDAINAIAGDEVKTIFDEQAATEQNAYDNDKSPVTDRYGKFIDDFFDLVRSNPAIRRATTEFLSNRRDYFLQTEQDIGRGMDVGEERKAEFLLQDILYTRRYFSNLGDDNRSFVIAEANSAYNTKTAIILEELTQDTVNLGTKVSEVKILIENPYPLDNSSKIVSDMLEDPRVRDYLMRNSEPQTIVDATTLKERPKTVFDLKTSQGLSTTEADKGTPVQGKFVVMFAGSDSLKGLGMAAKYVIAYQKYQIAKTAAELGIEVEFKKGNGPAPNRDGEDDLSPDQTIQGVENNNTPVNFAYRTMYYMAHNMTNQFDVTTQLGQTETQGIGNRAFGQKPYAEFEADPQAAAKLYEEFRDIGFRYNNLYRTGLKGLGGQNLYNDYYARCTLSPDAKLTALAARPTKRVGAAGEDVTKARSISYGSSLVNNLVHLIDSTQYIVADPKEAHALAQKFPIIDEMLKVQASFGAFTANIEYQWRLLDNDIRRGVMADGQFKEEKNGLATHIKIGNNAFSMADLEARDADVMDQVEQHFQENLGYDAEMLRSVKKAIFVAAHVDQSYVRATQQLTQFWKEDAFTNGRISQAEYKQERPYSPEAAYQYMPKEYADQFKTRKENFASALEQYVGLREEVRTRTMAGEDPKAVKDELRDQLFEAAAATKTVLEYTSPALEVPDRSIKIQQTITQERSASRG